MTVLLLLVLGATGAAVVAALRSVIFVPGIPAFQHDWAWSPVQSQLQTLITGRLGLWEPGGLRGYNVDALSYAPLVVVNLLAFVFSSSVTIRIILLLCAGLACTGATWLAYRQAASLWLAPFVGLVYAIGPVFVNKLGSGQINAWFAYAALPWAVLCILGDKTKISYAQAGGLALCSIFIASQIHVFVAFSLMLLIVLAAGRSWNVFAVALIGLSAGALSQAFGIGEALFAWNSGGADQYQARIPWEASQSPQLLDAVGLTGYYTRYFETMAGSAFLWIHWVQIGLAATAFWGLLQTKGAQARAFFVMAVVLLLAVSSFHTPLRPAAAWFFTSFSWASVFRELYNLEELVALIYCIGLGAALANRQSRRFVLPLLAVLLVSYIVPSYGHVLHLARLNDHVAAANFIARQPGSSGVWPLPNGRFLTDMHHEGGYDPFQGRLGDHPLVEQYFAQGAIAAAQSRGVAAAAPLLRVMGVGYIWCRTGLTWLPPQWSPSLKVRGRVCVPPALAITVSGDSIDARHAAPTWRTTRNLVEVPDVWSLGIGQLRHSDFIFARDATPLGFVEGAANTLDSRSSVNPHQGPIPQSLGNRADPRFSEIAQDADVIARNLFQSFATREPGAHLLVATHLRSGSVLYQSRGYTVALCRELARCLSPRDRVAVVGPALQRPLVRARRVRLNRALVLVQNSQYRPTWRASIGSLVLPHFRVDGFANGWLVPQGALGRISFFDPTERILIALRAASIAAWGIPFALFLAALAVRKLEVIDRAC